MRGDRIENPDGWAADQWMPIPGGAREHRARFWIAGDAATKSFRLSARPVEGLVIGIEVQHRRDDGEWCGGYVTPDDPIVDRWGVHPSGHRVLSYSPLHIEASLACKRCPSHGFVRNGNWEGAPD